MESFFKDGDKNKTQGCKSEDFTQPGSTDTTVQLVISLALGISAFFAFCALRPRWKALYEARKRRVDPVVKLPQLPDTFFGWIPALYRVTEQQLLASAGLDAFVFLAFFKMAIKLFGTMFFFAAVVLEPINLHFIDNDNDGRTSKSYIASVFRIPSSGVVSPWATMEDDSPPDKSFDSDMGYLWSYLVFTYFFSILTMYFMDKETRRVIRVRQDYLGTQMTLTDRTFQLSGIPKDLRTEEKIKELVERLEIGKVESVTLCRNWKDLDDLVDQRSQLLHMLEETWTVYLGQKPAQPILASSSRDRAPEIGVGDEEAGESGPLLTAPGTRQLVERKRPQTRVWYGFLGWQSRVTDALDYYEEKLRRLDEKIHAARKRTYEPADLAFVTMDSIAACQMAIQALIDPRPGQLLTKPAPAPSDVVWRNTYEPRVKRNARGWVITAFVGVLTIVWLIPVAFLASFLSICTIRRFFPGIADSLSRHDVTRALVQTGLPTGVVSLLNVAVPYLYDFLSYYQGRVSRATSRYHPSARSSSSPFSTSFSCSPCSARLARFLPWSRRAFATSVPSLPQWLARSRTSVCSTSTSSCSRVSVSSRSASWSLAVWRCTQSIVWEPRLLATTPRWWSLPSSTTHFIFRRLSLSLSSALYTASCPAAIWSCSSVFASLR